MKNVVAAAGALLLALCLAACSAPSGSTPKPTEGAESAEWSQVEDGQVTATYHLADNFSDGLIRTSAQSDTIELLQESVAKFADADSVTISGWFPMKDQYGEIENKEVLHLTYDRATIDRINFKNIGTDQIWPLASEAVIHPAIAG